MEDPTPQKISAWLVLGWKKGIKTAMYYLRQKAPVDPENYAIDSIRIPEQSKSTAPKQNSRSYEALAYPKVKNPSPSRRQLSKSIIPKMRCNEEVCTSCQS